MMIALEQIAATLQVTPEDLWRQSLEAYVLHEKRSVQLDVADIQDRYGVSTVNELRGGSRWAPSIAIPLGKT